MPCSLEPFEAFDFASSALSFNFSSHEVANRGVIGFVSHEVELSLDEVFERDVLLHDVRNILTTEHENTFDIEVRLFSEHGDTGEGVSAELGVNSLDESTEQVDEFVQNLSFSSVLIVFEVPE